MNDVLTKADMYRRIVKGEFGNTLQRWFDVNQWSFDTGHDATMKGDDVLWGVQHTETPGFPGTRLNVPRQEVRRVIESNGFCGHYCIGPMVTQIAGPALWEGDVARGLTGLYCSGNAKPTPGSWRRHMLTPRLWERSAALVLLRSVLNDNSYDDVMELLDMYPDHVVELSALSRCFGTVPGRNAVIWEVRRY